MIQRLALVSFILLLMAVGPAARADDGRSPLHAGPWGTRAAVELLRAEGFDVRLWDRPLWEEVSREGGLILLLAPEAALEPEEVAALIAHVRRGGRLIYAVAGGPGGGVPSEGLLAAAGLGLAPGEGGAGEVAVMPIPGAAIPEGRIPAVGGPRLAWLGEAPSTGRVIAEDGGGLVAVAVQEGAGVLVAVAELTPFANRWLGEGASAGLVVGLVETFAGDRPVVVDGWHHGIRGEASLLTLLLASPWRFALFQALLVAAAALLAWGRRQVAPAEEGPTPMPGPGPQVDALAALYQRAGADALAAEALLDDFCRRAAPRLGMLPADGPPALIAAACRRCGVDPAPLVEGVAAARRPGGAEAAAWLDRRLTTLLRRIEDVPTAGR